MNKNPFKIGQTVRALETNHTYWAKGDLLTVETDPNLDSELYVGIRTLGGKVVGWLPFRFEAVNLPRSFTVISNNVKAVDVSIKRYDTFEAAEKAAKDRFATFNLNAASTIVLSIVELVVRAEVSMTAEPEVKRL